MVKPLSCDTLTETVNLYKEHGTIEKAAAAAGVSYSTFQHRLTRAKERDVMPREAIPEGHMVKGISSFIDEDGNIIRQWIKTKAEEQQVVDSLKKAFAEYEGRSELVPPPTQFNRDLLSVYPIADQHHGMLSWGKETGENYDLEIGAKRLRTCMNRLVSQSPPSTEAVILNLGDWQHNDNQRNMTPMSGNILDMDGRYIKVLTTGVQLMMDCIELALAKHAKVIVRNLPGNHDPHASVALTIALSAFYSNNDRVQIDDDPSEFFFHRFGNTLIGANHGHRMKPDRMAISMATRRREDWGQTKYHYFYYGHIHKELAHEVGDVRVESFQTLAAKDAWSSATGYNSGQSLTSILIHEQDGEIGRHRVNV